MAHPYDWSTVHMVAGATHNEWFAGTLTALLAVSANAKEGDRAYIEECLAWVTHRTIVLTDGSSALRWVPDDPMWGRNNIPAGAGSVPVGTVSTEGVWTIAADYNWTDVDVSRTYDVLAITFTTVAASLYLGGVNALTTIPAYLWIRCLHITKTAGAFAVYWYLKGGGYPGGLGGVGATVDGAPGNGSGGLSGPVYVYSRGGGGGSGGNSVAGGGGKGGDSDHVTGAMWKSNYSTNAVGAAPSGNAGAAPNIFINTVSAETWSEVDTEGSVPVGGGGGGGGEGNGGAAGGNGGAGGGVLFIDAACVAIPVGGGILSFSSIGDNGVQGTNAVPASGGGGGAGGGGGGGGLCRVRYRRGDNLAGGLRVSGAHGVGGAGGAGDGAGVAGGAGSDGIDGIALQLGV